MLDVLKMQQNALLDVIEQRDRGVDILDALCKRIERAEGSMWDLDVEKAFIKEMRAVQNGEEQSE